MISVSGRGSDRTAPQRQTRRVPRRRPRMSTRTRVLGWFMLIVAVALALNIVVVNEFVHNRVRSRVDAELNHEMVKFDKFARRGVDPATGHRFDDVAAMLKDYVADAVPEEEETLFSVIDGKATHRKRNNVPVRLDHQQEVIRQAMKASRPAKQTIKTSAGTVNYAVVPARRGQSQRAALVIAEFSGQARADAAQVVRITTVASVAALLAAGGISWFVAGRILAPLRQVRRTAESISESDLTRRIAVTSNARDDLARLAVTFNRMLDRLEDAFRVQRGFLDDAAHELRTPLTVIRGHLELMGDDPADRAETTQLLLEEISRMNRIVDELLLLAAAERPDFLTPADTDLTDLITGTIDRAAGLADRRWTISETSDARVRADAQRLTQALLQLASNAVRYTAPGDDISFGAAIQDDEVVLTVADGGPGVPDDVKPTVFDRFAHGTPRSGDGPGLGLAIVASIAVAHRGSVTVGDTPGGGATFSIRFPLRRRPVADPGGGSGQSPSIRGNNRPGSDDPTRQERP